MEFITHNVTEKLLVAVLVSFVLFVLYFSIEIYLFLTRRDFGNVDIYLADFTKDKSGNGNVLRFELIGHKIPLWEIYRNRFHVLRVMTAGTQATPALPVLRFYDHADRLLKPIRNRIAAVCSSMVLKRATGFSSKQTWYQVCVVYDRSDDVSHYILKIVLVKDSDIERFNHFRTNPPRLGTNYELLKKIVLAYESADRIKHGSFVQVRITTS